MTVLNEMYNNDFEKYKNELRKYRELRDADYIHHASLFFDEHLLSDISETFDIKILEFSKISKKLSYERTLSGYTLDTKDPTPQAMSLEESISQLLSFIFWMESINNENNDCLPYSSSFDIVNVKSIIEAFFKRYENLDCAITVENEKIIVFKDASKKEFIESMSEFNKKVSNIKSKDPEVTKIVSALKVDLGSLIKNLKEDEEKFEFKKWLKLAKEIAIKSKPIIKFIVAGIGFVVDIKGFIPF